MKPLFSVPLAIPSFLNRAKDISFESRDGSDPAKFYINSAPAHKTYPTVLIKPNGTPEEGVVIVKDENKVELGSLEDANHRVNHTRTADIDHTHFPSLQEILRTQFIACG